MPIQSFDLAIDQYADFQVAPVYSLVVSVGSTPVPVNLAGYTARMMIRVLPSDAVPIVSVSTTSNAQGSIVLQPILNGIAQLGMIQVSINRATTGTMPSGTVMQYDLELDTPIGTTIDFMAGYARVKAGNTH